MLQRRWLCAALALLPACQGAPPSEPSGTVIVGITSEFEPGVDLLNLQADTMVDGATPTRATWSFNGSEPLAFPIELPFEELPEGARIDVALSVFEGSTLGGSPFMTRQLSTSIVAGRALLLRAHLDWECVPSFHLAGSLLAPTCTPPQTCIAAACKDPYVPPSMLELYAPTWAVDFADECRPLDAGPSEVAVGQGLETYGALVPGGAVPMHLGNQGGYHVWLALRMKNLHRAGSTTMLTAERKSTGEELCSLKVPWDYAPAGNGYCDIPGIQCVVTNDVQGSSALDGEAVTVRATIVDATGEVGVGEQEITLAAGQ